MGCLCSRGQTQDGRANRSFKVINVDDHGQERNPGRIEITELELVWFQRGKEPVCWPLNSLRRYGFDAELFSFECGRRCPTGPGIYAFKCRQAEALFNLLQESVQRQRTVQDEITPAATMLSTATVPVAPTQTENHSSSNGNAVVIRIGSNPTVHAAETVSENTPLYVNETPHEYINTNIAMSSRQNSITSPSGLSVAIPPAILDDEHVIQYAELDLPTNGDNGSLGEPTPVHVPNGNAHSDQILVNTSSQQAMYINVPACEIKATITAPKSCGPRNGLSRQPSKGDDGPRSYTNVPKSVSAAPNGHRVNYVQLDLDNNTEGASNGISQSLNSPLSSNPESPTRKTETYAMIDIERTQALNNRLRSTDDEGSRKTRHNSNIDELL